MKFVPEVIGQKFLFRLSKFGGAGNSPRVQELVLFDWTIASAIRPCRDRDHASIDAMEGGENTAPRSLR
jgi:hypothetical protein